MKSTYNMIISEHDRRIPRKLGQEYAEAAAQPINGERAQLWLRLNRLELTRPRDKQVHCDPWLGHSGGNTDGGAGRGQERTRRR